MRRPFLRIGLIVAFTSVIALAQSGTSEIRVEIKKVSQQVHLLRTLNGFGGGNVAASIGDDGVLIVDTMYAAMKPKLEAAIRTVSDKKIEMVLNTHFHSDHIQGNEGYRNSAVIIAQENVRKRLIANNKPESPTLQRLPNLTFSNTLSIYFNGEQIELTHYPNSHTDGDVAVFFTRSHVLHLGDMYFAGMFPSVYAEGGGNIRGLIASLEKIAEQMPTDVRIIPGHGEIGTLDDLKTYIAMLKETISIVEANIRAGKSVAEMQREKILAKYDALGSGGAQTTDQYIAMLDKLIRAELATRIMKNQARKK